MTQAVLFDRDGTLVVDVPYNGDAEMVTPIQGAGECVNRLRAAGLKLGVVTNQSGVGRGTITRDQMNAVNGRIDALIGPFDGWFVCVHAPEEDCECRKPRPKLLLDAANAFGASPAECVFIGDKDDDAEAARAAGVTFLRVSADRTLEQACEAILKNL